MGYISFYLLRCDVAATISEEFGEHYKNMATSEMLCNKEAYDQKTKELVRKYGLRKRSGMMSFLYSPDVGYRLTSAKCREVYDQIRDTTNNKQYGYTARENKCMSFDEFKELLRICAENNHGLKWY